MLVEEAIEILKEIIELHEDNCYLSTEDDFKAIKTLIEAYEKQSEEIDDWKFTKNYVEDNYIHKNKIKRKIEELKKYSKDHGYINMRSEINMLQSLLEKE